MEGKTTKEVEGKQKLILKRFFDGRGPFADAALLLPGRSGKIEE